MPPSNFPLVFATPRPVSLSVKTRAGRIQVSADDVTETIVDLQPMKPGDPEAQDVIARARIDHHGDAVGIEVSRRASGPSLLHDPSIDVRVTVPRHSTVSAQSGSADVHLFGGLGDVSVKTGSGHISVDGCAGASTKTGSGDIRVRDAVALEAHTGSGDIIVEGAVEDVDADTGSGNIRVGQINGKAELRAASGDIDVDDLSARLVARTASGDIRIRRAVQGEIEMKSASGDVTVGVATGTAAKLECSSVSGRVRSDLQPSDAPGTTEHAVVINSRTVSGSITIARAG